jgi:predicted nicotinamide N-methyase
VWPGSRALARLLAAVDCDGRRVVEIGCGLGLAGLVAARRGASVMFFDAAAEPLQFVRRSAELNACRAALVQANLYAPGLRGEFDYCLAADITYDPGLQAAAAGFLAAHLARDGRAWCAESVRTVDRGFRDACAQHGLRVSERTGYEPDEPRDSRVRITEVRW